MRSNRSNRTRSHPGCQVALTALTDWPISVLSGVKFCRSLYLSFAWDDMATATWKHFPQGAWYCIGIQGSTSAPNMMKYIMISMINHDTTGILTYLISRCNGIALRPENRFCQASNGFKGCFGQVWRVFIHWSLGTWAIRAGWSNITFKSIDFSSWIKLRFWVRVCQWCALAMSSWRFWTFENTNSWSLNTYLKHPRDSAESHSLDSLGLGSGNSLRTSWGHPEDILTFSEILRDPDAKDSAQRHSELFRVGRTGPGGVGQFTLSTSWFSICICIIYIYIYT